MAKIAFQTEIKQLLDLMIHSLYSNKEIFLRELISNASDALDKLNHLTLSDDKYKSMDFKPRIDISFDSDKKTLTISDNGIGMDESDLKNHLGTIAKSGTKSFLESLSGDKKKDSNLIGQFGVGFYSCFMVASKVVVNTRKALDNKAYTWISDGGGEYEIIESSKDTQGTEITLFLNESGQEFANRWSIEDIIKKYSSYIQYPIFVHYEEEVAQDSKDTESKEKPQKIQKEEQVNAAKALWVIPKNELKEADYDEFYKTLSYDREKPLKYIHTLAEGSLSYKSLFYIPATPPLDMNRVDYQSHVKLYVKRVFITDDDKELLPPYLRFIYGVIDSDDLPLNVSREILQENRILEQIKAASVKKILAMLESMAKDSKLYADFWAKFGKVLKEGLYGFGENKDKLLDLVRAYSYKKGENISLKEYKEAMVSGQDSVFYLIGKDLDSIKNNPILEKFKDYDVLLFSDEVDNFVVPQIGEYSGVKLLDISSAEAGNKVKSEISEDSKKEFEPILESFKGLDGVGEVSLINGISSPIALSEQMPGNSYMEQIMRQMGQEMPEPKKNVEINISSPLIAKINALDSTKRNKYALVLFNGAKILEGVSLKDSKSYIESVNEILESSL
ncbi:molecular chaperone HtpG [Helicobacter saguini]|uniref:Chaperone protein HtpG n=2 Tax=Helicobacter saguini TaxID=1548018 RepID=A0A347VRP2_9HELI|nr:molecular chaperone HtpG [Helicobacter saguini]MWV62830.1 molecular chaperone HtpG [Helicobacter saguini]MWV66501.1 molecular chaperone HtpG [Helicobacter saguini]MWV68850.1 molecular chaperone HtpG [Helicobacter saguini]MWV71595.1 molecular chaperone HtpG [Helicobacter saguini]TLD94401.1 molecular chaperone HtpG [Helicobacter saguini]